jgi:hypothetical protein
VWEGSGPATSRVLLNRQRRDIILVETAQRVAVSKRFKEVILDFPDLEVGMSVYLPLSVAGLHEPVILAFNFYDHNKRSISLFRPTGGQAEIAVYPTTNQAKLLCFRLLG